MSTQHLIQEISRASSTQGSLENKEVINYINRYILNDFMTDIGMLALRKAVTLEPISEESDCYIPNNTAERGVQSITAPIQTLENEISSYTNREMYAATDNAYEINGYLYNAYSTQRESEFFKLGNTIYIGEGYVSNASPFVMQQEELASISNYWTRIAVYEDEKKITSVVFSKVVVAKSISSLGFNFYLDFARRTLTVSYTGNKQGNFTCKVETFESCNGLLITQNAIFGRKYISRRNFDDSSIFIECLVHPLLLFGDTDSLDSTLKQIRSIVILGAAKNISYMLQDSVVQESTSSKYDSELARYQDIQKDKDGLEFLNSVRVSDPINYCASYLGLYNNYGYRR